MNVLFPFKPHLASLKAMPLIIVLLNPGCKAESHPENLPIAWDTLTIQIAPIEDQMKTNKEKQTVVADTAKTPGIMLPKPKVELPELSYDKKKLSKIGALDQMLTDAEIVKVASQQFEEMFNELRDANQRGSLDSDGTTEGTIRVINKVAESFRKFDQTGKVLGEKVIAFVKNKYTSESAYSSSYRDTYLEAEAQAGEIILNNELRRKVISEISTFYKYGSSVSLYLVESKLRKAVELKAEAIDNLLSSANSHVLVADYKKGRELTDLLNGTMNRLDAIQVLNPSDEDKASIEQMKVKVAAAKKKRVADIVKAREEYHFPQRYKSGNTPSNAAELEKKMETFLERSMYNGKDTYDVKKIVVAGPWVEVRSVLGVVMYYQIDFYAAVKYKHDEPGVLNVALVTGKTSGAAQGAFGTYSIGTVGEMLEKNLD